MLFDLQHVLFFTISFILIGIGIFLCVKFVKDDKNKDLVLKLSAVFTVIIHYSTIWYHYLVLKTEYIESNMLFLVYPCNIGMWFLFIYAFIQNKNTIFARLLATFTFYLGVMGGLIGILFNINYSNTPSLKDFDIFKGLLSHVTMLFGSIYLYAGGYMKIRVKNLIAGICGFIFMILDGYFVITVFRKFELDPPNSMFLIELPIPSMPFINIWTIGLAGLVVMFVITASYEYFFLKKEDRWYTKLKEILNKRKEEQN